MGETEGILVDNSLATISADVDFPEPGIPTRATMNGRLSTSATNLSRIKSAALGSQVVCGISASLGETRDIGVV
jgi:hypothetical protein